MAAYALKPQQVIGADWLNTERYDIMARVPRQTLYLGTDAAGPLPCGELFIKITMRSALGNGRGLSSTVSTTEKIAVLAPIPWASAATAVMVNPGLRRNVRKACFKSLAS